MLNPRLRLEWLVSFLSVVENGGFGAAAEAMHRSQPRVSMHVAELERSVGVELLDRRRRPVELTAAGESMAMHVRKILTQVQATENEMSGWCGGRRGIVYLGSYPSASAAIIPDLLLRLRQEVPDITVSLVERSTLELDEAAREGQIDLYLRPMSPPPSVSGVRSMPLWREDLVAVLPADHRLAVDDEPLSVSEIAELPLISIGQLDPDSQLSFETYQLFRGAGLELHPVQATNQPQTLVSMVQAGLGVGVTNRLAVQMTDHRGVFLRPLAGHHERVVAVCWMGDASLSPAARSLLKLIRDSEVPDGTIAVG